MSGKNIDPPAVIRAALAALIIALALCLGACGEVPASTGDSPRAETPAAEAQPPAETVRLVNAIGPPPHDLELTVVGDRGTLSWSSLNPGDYNVDGVVDMMDMFLLAANFGKATGEYPELECVDGNSDGALNGQDLFAVSRNYLNRMDGYYVFSDSSLDGDFSGMALNFSLIDYLGCGAEQQYEFTLPDSMAQIFAVRPWDAHADELGEAGNAAYLKIWRVMQPAGEGASGWRPSAAYDNANMPAVAWENEQGTISVGLYRDGAWNVDQPEFLTGGFYDPSLAFDRDNHPCVAYYDSERQDLRFARHDGEAWQLITIDSSGIVGKTPSLAFDSEGHPAIAYQGGPSYGLKLARFDGTVWTPGTIYGGPGGYQPSLAFDDNGYPLISHYVTDIHDLLIAWYKGGSWEFSTIDAIDEVGGHGRLQLDASSDPFVSYYDSTHDQFKTACWNGSDWTFATSPLPGSGPSALDALDRQVMAFSHDSTRRLTVARRDGDEWISETVSAAKSPYYTSIAIDENYNPLIAFTRIGHQDLWVVWLAPEDL